MPKKSEEEIVCAKQYLVKEFKKLLPVKFGIFRFGNVTVKLLNFFAYFL